VPDDKTVICNFFFRFSTVAGHQRRDTKAPPCVASNYTAPPRAAAGVRVQQVPIVVEHALIVLDHNISNPPCKRFSVRLSWIMWRPLRSMNTPRHIGISVETHILMSLMPSIDNVLFPVQWE
jgi:hypothetical protein